MTNLSQDEVLRQLRRHQYMLVGGGGLLITLAVILTCLLEIWAVTRGHLENLQDEVAFDARQLSDFTTRVTANVRNNVQSIELALRADNAVDSQWLRAFQQSEQALRVQFAQNAHPLLLLGASKEGSPEEARPYLQLAARLSPLVSITRERSTVEHSIYLYGKDKNFLLISEVPWPGDSWQRDLVAQRKTLFERLTAGLDEFADATRTNAQHSVSELRWFASYESPLTGKQVLRAASSVLDASGDVFGGVVYELPIESMKRLLSESSVGADYMVFDGTGQLMIASSSSPPPEGVELARLSLDQGLGRAYRRDYLGGQVLYGWTLGQNGWTLVYMLGWRDIADGLGVQLLVPILTAVTIIMITWVFLLLIKRRVLAPAVTQSQRVFESEQLSRTLIQTAPVGLALLVVESGEVLLRSPTMAVMQDRISNQDSELPNELARRYRQHAAAAPPKAQSQLLQEDLSFVASDGKVLSLSLSIAPVRYQEQDALVATFVDITDKKRLEQSLMEAKVAADNANAAKSSFLAAMSHEIRTPLNAILGNLELLAHSALDFQRDRLDTIRRSSDSLLAIISDVLDFSKIEAGELRLERIGFDLLDVASRSLAIFAPAARSKGLMLQGELADSTALPFQGDPTRLGQVLNNLLSNAIKFTERGHVILRVRVEVAEARVVLEVEDTGIGMSDPQLHQIFRPFSQADASINRRYGGTGLGLTLCQRLSQAMGGELSVRSQAGQGSLFQLILPLEPGLPPVERPLFGGERVLLLAAMPEPRDYLERVLCSWGLLVLSFQHPTQLDAETLATADALVLWGERMTWCAEDENCLVEDAAWVLDCSAEGPHEPTAAGRILSASVYGLKGLAVALEHTLQGRPLPQRVAPRLALPRRLRILVAEDNPVNQRLFEEQLQLLGCDVQVVADGERALAKLENERFSVLLTDLSMPGLDGYALARVAHERWPRMPVIAATANVTLQERERCQEAGMALVLTKPLSLEALAKALREICAAHPEVGEGEAISALAPMTPEPKVVKRGWLGGAALPADVQTAFDNACVASLVAIRRAQLMDDAGTVLLELHSLRGAFGVFQLEQLARQASELDEMLRRLGCLGATASIDAFCDTLERSVLQAPKDVESLVGRLVELATAGSGEHVAGEVRHLCEALQRMQER